MGRHEWTIGKSVKEIYWREVAARTRPRQHSGEDSLKQKDSQCSVSVLIIACVSESGFGGSDECRLIVESSMCVYKIRF